MSNMIPFSGPGKYRLANGQIVNLDNRRRCRESDKILSKSGIIASWLWDKDGSIGGCDIDSTQLCLVEKLPDVKYYKHKNKFDNCIFIKRLDNIYTLIALSGKELSLHNDWTTVCDSFVKDGLWIEVSEQEAEKTIEVAKGVSNTTQGEIWPKYFVGKHWSESDAYVQFDSPVSYFWVNKKGVCSSLRNDGDLIEKHLALVGWEEVTKEEALKRVISSNVNSVTSVPDVLSSKKEEGNTVKKETAINVATGVAKFVGKWGWRTVNYWLFEPVTEVATKTMRTVRYVTLAGAIVGGVYTYNNPDKAADLIKSCLPKITVEAPEILKG